VVGGIAAVVIVFRRQKKKHRASSQTPVTGVVPDSVAAAPLTVINPIATQHAAVVYTAAATGQPVYRYAQGWVTPSYNSTGM
jgi:hypothetical protein